MEFEACIKTEIGRHAKVVEASRLVADRGLPGRVAGDGRGPNDCGTVVTERSCAGALAARSISNTAGTAAASWKSSPPSWESL